MKFSMPVIRDEVQDAPQKLNRDQGKTQDRDRCLQSQRRRKDEPKELKLKKVGLRRRSLKRGKNAIDDQFEGPRRKQIQSDSNDGKK
jgi:hypothetical protein